MFSVDELINWIQARVRTRSGRRSIAALCVMAATLVIVVPLARRSPAPAAAVPSRADNTVITIPRITTLLLPSPVPPLPPDVAPSHRFGPPLPTAPTTTVAPSTTTTPPSSAPVTLPAPTSVPPTAPRTVVTQPSPTTSLTDTGVAVPTG